MLLREIVAWEPRVERVPIHTWVHPWLILLDLAALYPTIEKKLGLALLDWHPEDSSALLVLRPWARVLPNFPRLLSRHILPKLLHIVYEMPFDDPAPMGWVLSWTSLFPEETVKSVFTDTFLPRWRQELAMKLASHCEMEEILNWVELWESVVPPCYIDFRLELSIND